MHWADFHSSSWGHSSDIISTQKQLQLVLPRPLLSLARNLTAGSPGVFSEWLLNSNSKILICKTASVRQSSALLWFSRCRHITKITEEQTLSWPHISDKNIPKGWHLALCSLLNHTLNTTGTKLIPNSTKCRPGPSEGKDRIWISRRRAVREVWESFPAPQCHVTWCLPFLTVMLQLTHSSWGAVLAWC